MKKELLFTDKYYWLFDNDDDIIKEKLRFNDRIEYRIDGKLDNSTGPALINVKTNEKRYFIKGIEYNEDDWNIQIRSNKIKKIKSKIKKNE